MAAVFAFIRRHPIPLLLLCTGALFAMLYLAAAGNGWGMYRRLAEAMLAGRLDIAAEHVDILHLRDLSVFEGRYYYPMGVLPALVMLPGVAIFGLDFPQGALVSALAVAIGLFTFRLARKFDWGERDALWLTVAVLLASPLSYLILRGTAFDAYLAHLLALMCLLGALLEYFGRRRPWVIGAWLGFSALARPLTILGIIFFLTPEFFSAAPWQKKFLRVGQLLTPVLATALLIAAYNGFRFGNPLEVGYTYQLIDPDTVAARGRGQFSGKHIPGNLYRALIAGPVPIFAAQSQNLLRFPYLTFDGRGLSWFITFPVLWLLFTIRLWRPHVIPSLATAATIAIALFTSFAHGEHQYGWRFGFDFFPFVLVALLAGLPAPFGRVGRALTIIGLLFNAWLTLPVLFNLPVVGGQ